jgi:hypothetical protein
VKVHLLGRAGKATGKYKAHWNVTDDTNIMEFNFDVIDWKVCSDAAEQIKETDDHEGDTDVGGDIEQTENIDVNLCNIFVSHIDEQTHNAKFAELKNWTDEKVYDEVEDIGQETISVRWVVTPKLVDGSWITKARLVARGFEEDQAVLRTDSPTCMRESLKIVLAVAISKQWRINSIDIKAAFLQGKPINRKVYLKPPTEANCQSKVWLLKKVVYGLSDASRVWYLRVLDELTKLGVTVSKYDKALFIWWCKNEVQGFLVVHVDDFLWCGSTDFYTSVIEKIKSIFKVSKESEGIFKYIGINLRQHENDLILDQRSYIESIQPIVLPDLSGLIKHQEVNSQMRKMFRGLVGQLSWPSGISRPDASFSACSLSTVQSKPKYRDLFEANKAIRELKNTYLELKYPRLDLPSVRLSVHSDASYANLADGGSQGGFIVFLHDSKGNCSPITWSSKRIKRVVRSTLSAETLSAVDALDSAYLVSNILKEVLGREGGVDICINMYTDNKSLYDAVNTSNLVLDKRLRVDISALREMNDNGEVHFCWVDSAHQLADTLTRKGASKKKLLEVLKLSYLNV